MIEHYFCSLSFPDLKVPGSFFMRASVRSISALDTSWYSSDCDVGSVFTLSFDFSLLRLSLIFLIGGDAL